MAYGVEVMIPIKVGTLSQRCLYFDEMVNKDLHRVSLELQNERQANSQLRLADYQTIKVRNISFKVNDWVLKKVFLAEREVEDGTIGPTREGHNMVGERICPETYKLEDSSGKETRRL
ncbi:Ribonuclease H-like domain containing protein [Abeliophyllum distichum]|uniref:Ribonuclease H-like domain containing protein n=1 Tax=Abeliophyllum distichum TaxID=126358 RepID=A0ABD1Q6B7_9LAMI